MTPDTLTEAELVELLRREVEKAGGAKEWCELAGADQYDPATVQCFLKGIIEVADWYKDRLASFLGYEPQRVVTYRRKP